MSITDRDIQEGQTFTATHKGQEWVCTAEADGPDLFFRLEREGSVTYHKTLSGAAKAITHGEVNGWAFWTPCNQSNFTTEDTAPLVASGPYQYERVEADTLREAGYRFLSEETDTGTAQAQAQGGENTKTTDGRTRLLRKSRSQSGLYEGETRYFCAPCGDHFVWSGKSGPLTCPLGHVNLSTRTGDLVTVEVQ